MISLIFPVYNEELNLPLLYERVSKVADGLTKYEFEIIFVDDCSSDRSEEILQSLREKDPRVHIIRFSKNCGAHAAIAAGFDFCRGQAAIKMAADLQDPPEFIPRLLEEWEKGYRVVWGQRSKRLGESLRTRMLSRAFYYLMNKLTDIRQPAKGADVTLLDRTVIDVLVRSSEKNASNNMIIAWLGFSQKYIEYTKDARHAGESKWTFSKRVKLFLDSLISFSYLPLRAMSVTGLILSIIAGLFSLRVLYNKIFHDIEVLGWASLMIVVLIIGGFQMMMLGILGEYVWRTYDETRNRPKYVVEKNTFIDENEKI